jgi:lysine 2,3-aminomutase
MGDWKQELAGTVRDVSALERHLRLTDAERAAIEGIDGLPLGVTPRFLSLMDPDDPACPIRRQVVPSAAEVSDDWAHADPLGEEAREEVPFLVHRYPDRALLLVTDRCAAYCRFCTRKRVVGQGPTAQLSHLEAAVDYVRARPGIREVILSGGDALVFDDEKLARLLGWLRTIEHLDVIRVATRVPAFVPSRVTPELVALLRAHKPVYALVHFNHPRELEGEAAVAVDRLVEGGVPVLAQTVLLRGVNDDADTLEALFRGLVRLGAKPYYLHQCDLAEGTAGFRVPLDEARRLVGGLRGRISGIAMPTFVVDIPGGHGKVPAEPSPVVDEQPGFVELRGFSGGKARYPRD